MRNGWERRGWRGAAGYLGAAALSMLLAACATPHAPVADEAAVRAYVERGYVAASKASVTTSTQEWLIDGNRLPVVLAMPNGVRAAPLVIYVPGMGEPATAGERWRNAWAAAGYAVSSIQALAEDANAWRSDLARDADFNALGQQRYAGAVMSQRVRVLAEVVAEAQRRAQAGAAPWASIDWQRIAIAGFDLGAYTAMAVAGEHIPDAEDVAGRLKVRAAIALSPFARVAAGAIDSRYNDVHLPVLSLTGHADSDVIGLVASPAQRTLPFEHMPGPDDYLLSLRGLPHAEFSGTASVAAEPREAKRARGSASQQDGGNGGGQRSRRRQQKGAANAVQDSDAGAGPDDGDSERDAAPRLSATALQMRLAAAEEVSTAFLDAYLKGEPAARAWLGDGASRWLGESGELRRR